MAGVLVDPLDALLQVETRLWWAVDARLRASVGLTMSSLRPLQVISRRPRCRLSDLAAELCMTRSGASKLADRLVGEGYCRRVSNPADRRSSLLKLTPRGARVVASGSDVMREEASAVLRSEGTGRRLIQLTDALHRLHDEAQRTDI